MKEKILTIVTVVTMLFGIIGCGNENYNQLVDTSGSKKIETKLRVEFKSNKLSSHYVNKNNVTSITITLIDKENTSSDFNITQQINGDWNTSITLTSSHAPYSVSVEAKDSNGTIIFKTLEAVTITKNQIENNTIPALILVGVDSLLSVNLPTVEDINITSTTTDNVATLHFLINGAVKYELFSSIANGFSQNDTNGTLNNAILDVNLTIPDGTDLGLETFFITLFNARGDSVKVNFQLSGFYENGTSSDVNISIQVNNPPQSTVTIESQDFPQTKLGITLANIASYNVTAVTNETTNVDYNWTRIIGAILQTQTDNNNVILNLINSDSKQPVCFDLTTIDSSSGSSSTIRYHVENAENGCVGLKATGQTASYDANGVEKMDSSIQDDGHYKKGLTSYYTREAETVIDHITGLVWQDNIDANSTQKNWLEAKTYCQDKGNGWRLPTIKELSNIVDRTEYESALNATFVYTNPNDYWSSTEDTNVSSNHTNAWTILFFDGWTRPYPKSLNNLTRCVR